MNHGLVTEADGFLGRSVVAARVAPLSLLVPVVGLWAAWAAFDEAPVLRQWVGTAAVLAGLLINQGTGWLQERRARSRR